MFLPEDFKYNVDFSIQVFVLFIGALIAIVAAFVWFIARPVVLGWLQSLN